MNRKPLVFEAIRLFKKHHTTFFSIGHCYYHKRICVDLTPGYENVYDTSTDLWRPLNIHELNLIQHKGFVFCNKYLAIKNTRNQLKNSRKDFRIATIKKHHKDQSKYYDKAMVALNKLRGLLGY